jgi:hypothetical protein
VPSSSELRNGERRHQGGDVGEAVEKMRPTLMAGLAKLVELGESVGGADDGGRHRGAAAAGLAIHSTTGGVAPARPQCPMATWQGDFSCPK